MLCPIHGAEKCDLVLGSHSRGNKTKTLAQNDIFVERLGRKYLERWSILCELLNERSEGTDRHRVEWGYFFLLCFTNTLLGVA